MGSNQAVAEKFRAAVEGGDLATLNRFLVDSVTDDFVEEWPQSGERIVGRDAVMKLGQSYEKATGTSPRMTFRRMVGAGDLYVVEGTIDYGDGTPVSYIGVAEYRDGKIAKVTEYFANPFEAPAWRADMVERMEPAGVR